MWLSFFASRRRNVVQLRHVLGQNVRCRSSPSQAPYQLVLGVRSTNDETRFLNILHLTSVLLFYIKAKAVKTEHQNFSNLAQKSTSLGGFVFISISNWQRLSQPYLIVNTQWSVFWLSAPKLNRLIEASLFAERSKKTTLTACRNLVKTKEKWWKSNRR